MNSSTRVPRGEITGVYGAVMKRVCTKMFGEMPEPLAVLWHIKPVLMLYLSLGRKSAK